MPGPFPFAKSASNTSSSKTIVGGDDSAADLERLLPHDSEAGEFGSENNESELEAVGSKRTTKSEVTARSEDVTSTSNFNSAAPTTTSGRFGEMGIDEQAGIKYEGRNGDRWANSVALVGVVTLAVSTWLTILLNDPASLGWFAFHPILQTFALACFTYGILTLQPTSQPKSKAAGFRRHQTAIFYIGVPTITLGTLAIWYNKWLRSGAHFKTWHGTFGLICMLWLLAQIFVGAGSVWDGGALFGGGMKAKALWKYHRMSGYILFPLMLFTAHLGGGWSIWGENNTNNFVRFVTYTLAPALILTGIYARVRLSKMKFW